MMLHETLITRVNFESMGSIGLMASDNGSSLSWLPYVKSDEFYTSFVSRHIKKNPDFKVLVPITTVGSNDEVVYSLCWIPTLHDYLVDKGFDMDNMIYLSSRPCVDRIESGPALETIFNNTVNRFLNFNNVPDIKFIDTPFAIEVVENLSDKDNKYLIVFDDDYSELNDYSSTLLKFMCKRNHYKLYVLKRGLVANAVEYGVLKGE